MSSGGSLLRKVSPGWSARCTNSHIPQDGAIEWTFRENQVQTPWHYYFTDIPVTASTAFTPSIFLCLPQCLESAVAPPLEPKHIVFLGVVCVRFVPVSWGQALFGVEVLRVYPNVQDLGVIARLSES